MHAEQGGPDYLLSGFAKRTGGRQIVSTLRKNIQKMAFQYPRLQKDILGGLEAKHDS